MRIAVITILYELFCTPCDLRSEGQISDADSYIHPRVIHHRSPHFCYFTIYLGSVLVPIRRGNYKEDHQT
jgi:hypothetical protein